MGTSIAAADGRRVAVGWLWALMVVLHLLFLPGQGAFATAFTGWNVTNGALGIAAIALLCRPRSSILLAVVAVLTPITAWMQAPALGNHWLLASLVSLTLLSAMTIGALRRPRDVDGAIEHDGFPAARVVFLIAYGFAALSKFNSSFADPTVSCATLYVDQVANSLGIAGLHAQGGAGWTHVVPFAVMAIEASVVVLLVIARTRVLGVIFALAFHGLISIDTTHPFSDFSSLIAVLVILFLPDEWFVALDARLRTVDGRRLATLATTVVAIVAATLLVGQAFDSSNRWWRAIGHGRDALWWIIALAMFVAVVTMAVRTRTIRADVAFLPVDRWLLAWPGLAVLIGLGPWLGVRTGTSWNMYANLVTSQGETNAWFAPGTLRLLDEPDDLVRITASDDPALMRYVDTGDLVPFINLRLYTSSHPDTSVTFERDGTAVTVEHTREDPQLGRAPEWWWRKVLTYRSIPAGEPTACQESMYALR